MKNKKIKQIKRIIFLSLILLMFLPFQNTKAIENDIIAIDFQTAYQSGWDLIEENATLFNDYISTYKSFSYRALEEETWFAFRNVNPRDFNNMNYISVQCERTMSIYEKSANVIKVLCKFTNGTVKTTGFWLRSQFVFNTNWENSYYRITLMCDEFKYEYNSTYVDISYSDVVSENGKNIYNVYCSFTDEGYLNLTYYSFTYEHTLFTQSFFTYDLTYGLKFFDEGMSYPFYCDSLGSNQILGTYCNMSNSLNYLRILYSPTSAMNEFNINSNMVDIITTYTLPVIPVEDLPYWTYTSFGIENDYEENMNFTNFDLTYNMIKQSQIPSKFYYNTETIDPESWGTWTGFKWLRNGLCAIINTLIVVLSFLMYVLTVAFNYLIMWIGTIIIIFIWNILIYYIFYAICFIVDFLWGMLLWLWNELKAVVDGIYNALTLAIDYLIDVLLPAIADFIIIAFSYVTAILLWILTLGRVSFAQLLEDATALNGAIADGLVSLFASVFEFLPYFFMYIVFYLNLLLMLYLKKFYCQAKSYTNRVAELELTLNAFMEPIRLGRNIIDFVKGCIPIIF